jgi:hypothetical protein
MIANAKENLSIAPPSFDVLELAGSALTLTTDGPVLPEIPLS